MTAYTRLSVGLILAALHLLTLRPSLEAAEAPYSRVLPGVVQTQVPDGARMETSAWVVNLGTSSASFEFKFLPTSNTSAPPAQVRALGPGETLRLSNVLLDLFGLGEGEGALVVRGNQPFELRGINSNTSNPSGTSGQGLNSLASSELLVPNATLHSLWLANRSEGEQELRTDITAVLAAPNTTLTVSVYDARGILRGIEAISSEEPAIWRTSASKFLSDPEIPLGRVQFAVTAGEATGFLSVSGRLAGNRLVAQAERIAASNPEGTSLLLNGVGASTTLRLFNPNETEQEIAIEALGFPGGPATIRRITLAANGLVEIPGVLAAEGFVFPEGAVGALRLRATLPFLASGRGLPVTVAYENGFARQKQIVTLVGLNENVDQPGRRSRIALLSGAAGASGFLRLRNTSGESISTSPLQLEANEWKGQPVATWFANTEIPADARVDIELENGSAHGYAEIVDTLTESRVLVAPTSIPVEVPPTPTAKRLVFSELPSSITTGTPFTATIRAIKEDDAVDTNFKGSVELRLAGGPGSLQAPAAQNAVEGIASFPGLSLPVAGRYTLTAVSAGLDSAVSEPFEVAAPPPPPPPTPTVIRRGTFAGQNGYTAQGTLQIERTPEGGETMKLNSNFRVSSGAGAVSVWLARSSGALNTSTSLRVGTINRVFAGEFTFPIPSQGSIGFTHVIVYCDGFRINFGSATLTNP